MGPKESQRINTSQSSAVFDVSLRGSEGSGAAASGERCGHLREPGEKARHGETFAFGGDRPCSAVQSSEDDSSAI